MQKRRADHVMEVFTLLDMCETKTDVQRFVKNQIDILQTTIESKEASRDDDLDEILLEHEKDLLQFFRNDMSDLDKLKDIVDHRTLQIISKARDILTDGIKEEGGSKYAPIVVHDDDEKNDEDSNRTESDSDDPYRTESDSEGNV